MAPGAAWHGSDGGQFLGNIKVLIKEGEVSAGCCNHKQAKARKCFNSFFFLFYVWWKKTRVNYSTAEIMITWLDRSLLVNKFSRTHLKRVLCTFRNKILRPPHTLQISPAQNRKLTEAAEQFHKMWISCQTPCCYSCHRLACRDWFTRQGWWLTDCWCLGQGCACFPFEEIHMMIASEGCLLDLYVVVSAMPFRGNKHNIWTLTRALQSGNELRGI